MVAVVAAFLLLFLQEMTHTRRTRRKMHWIGRQHPSWYPNARQPMAGSEPHERIYCMYVRTICQEEGTDGRTDVIPDLGDNALLVGVAHMKPIRHWYHTP